MKSTIDELLKQAYDYDNDKKFMAANDLCQELVKGTHFDNQTLEKICNVFIKHLDEPTSDIKGNAIKCLAKIVTRIPDHQVTEICTKLVQNLVNPQKEEVKNYDIYSTCLKTLINEVTEDFAEILCKTLSSAGLIQRTKIPEINEELIEITNQLIKRFTPYLTKHTAVLDRAKLTKELLENVNNDRSSLRRRSSNCLGTLSVILAPKDVLSIGESLFASMNANLNKKTLLHYAFALNSVTKYSAHKLAPLTNKLVPFILNDIESRLDNDADDFDLQNELLDYYLSILDAFIKKTHKEITPHLPGLLEKLPRLVTYDPNCVINFEKESDEDKGNEEGEEDEFWDDDDFDSEDSSWRVRRGAIRLTETFIKLRPELLKDVTENVIEQIVKCFKDKDTNIKLDVFSCLNVYLEGVTVSDKRNDDLHEDIIVEMVTLNRLKSSYKDIGSTIAYMIKQLTKLFKDPKNPNVAASQLLLNAARCIPSNMMEQWSIVFATIQKNFNNPSNPAELRVNLLTALRRLLRAQFHKAYANITNDYKEILAIVTEATTNSYFKISSEGFRVLSTFLRVLRPSLKEDPVNYNAYVKPIVPTVINRLKETDIDQEIKNAIISTVSVLISYFGDAIDSANLNLIFQHLLTKLKSEVTRTQTLKALSNIPVTELKLQINNEFNALLSDIATELCQLAQKQDRILKLSSLEVLKNVIYLLKVKLPKETQKDIVDVAAPYIKDEDFFLAQLALEVLIKIIEINPTNTGIYKDSIQNCVKLTKSALIQGNTTSRLSDVFMLIGAHKLADPTMLFNSLISEINKNCLATVSKALAGLILGVDEKSKQGFIQQLIGKIGSSGSESVIKQVSLLTIAEVGKKITFDDNKGLLSMIVTLFQSKEEDTKYYAAVALGGIAVGNIKFYLPAVLDLIKSNPDFQYLLLTTLKEIISQSDHKVHLKLGEENLIPFLFTFAKKSDESLNHIVSECIGKLCLTDLKTHSSLILANMKSDSVQVKYTTAAAFKYFCTKTTPLESISTLVQALFELVYDKDFMVQKAALSSLNTIVYNIPRTTHYITKGFLEALASACKFKPELVKEYELGPFKHKQDEGLPLRNAAFSFIDIALEFIYDKIEFSYIVEQVEKGIDDPSDDIQIIAYQILTKLANLVPQALIAHLERLTEKFEVAYNKILKALGSKQEGERANDCLRGFLRAMITISKIPESDEVVKFKELYNLKIASNEKCKEFIQQITSA